MYSRVALKIYSAVKQGILRSRYQFWKNFYSIDKINQLDIDVSKDKEFLDCEGINLICVFDQDFPKLQYDVKLADKPFLFLYQGDINLLNELNKNVAVIGTTKITPEIQDREENLLKILAKNNANVVSGLALGCDSVAHDYFARMGKKTIAFLPSTLDNIYPKANIKLAHKVLEADGLLVTEYINEPKDKYEIIKRFVERDRLQAMFCKAIVLIASASFGQGDSGSRHAVNKAKEYGIHNIFAMYNKAKDYNKPHFGLNKDLIEGKVAKVATKSAIEEIFIWS